MFLKKLWKLFDPVADPIEAYDPVEPYVDPYAHYLEKCIPHPKDPTVFFTTDPENLKGIHSHTATAVFCLREIPQELKDEIAALEANPELNELAERYRYNDSPQEFHHIREDMRYVAKLHAEVTGEPLQKPLLRTTMAEPQSVGEDVETTDADFHADSLDIGVRLHTTYAGPTIEGLSVKAIERLEKAGIKTFSFRKRVADAMLEHVTEDDIVNDVPLYAIGAFKGKGYVSPHPDSPPHRAWKHRGPKRWSVKGIAAVFGLPYASYELTAQRNLGGQPLQRGESMHPIPEHAI